MLAAVPFEYTGRGAPAGAGGGGALLEDFLPIPSLSTVSSVHFTPCRAPETGPHPGCHVAGPQAALLGRSIGGTHKVQPSVTLITLPLGTCCAFVLPADAHDAGVLCGVGG